MVRRSNKKKAKRQRRKKYVHANSKFKSAIRKLVKLNKPTQRQLAKHSSNKFIKDFGMAIAKIRNKADLFTKKQIGQLRRYKRKLRILANKRSSVQKKRQILNQKGGIAPILIPLIAAAIGSAGSVAGAAVHAAVSKS